MLLSSYVRNSCSRPVPLPCFGRSGRVSLSSNGVILTPKRMRNSFHKRVNQFKPRAEPDQKQGEAPPQQEPLWVRREKERERQAAEGKDGFKLQWPLALLFSVFTTIAATGSIFEYVGKNPVFGILQPDNPAWAPVLLFMAITGFPTAAFLFKYGVDGFNDSAEAQDRSDGYM